MKKNEQITVALRELMNKLAWLNKLKMEGSFGEYKSAEVHCIDYIGAHDDPNVTRLAEAFYMTRGAISKMTKKLINKGALEVYQKPGNKKEVHFRLTEQGERIYKIHRELHEGFYKRDKAMFEDITEEQYSAILEFTKKYSRHLDAEIQKLDLGAKR